MRSKQNNRDSLWKRIVYLDDLLHIAARANTSLDILTARRDPRSLTRSPLVEAIELHLQTAEEDSCWAARGQSLLHAARIAQLSHEMKKSMPHLDVVGVDPTRLFLKSTKQFKKRRLVRDLTLETVAEYEHVQSMRMAGKYTAAMKRAARAPERFAGTGAEMYLGRFEFEHTVACLRAKSLGRADDHLRRSDIYWERHERAQHWASGRARHEFASALYQIHEGQLGEARIRLGAAREFLTQPGWDGLRAVEQLSAALAVAECSAATWSAGDPANDILGACADALDYFEYIRGRWGVVARSPIAPAAVLRIVLGELAQLVAQIPTPEAGRLGLRIALAAKQSGYAELVRGDRTLLDDSLAVLLEEIVKLEQMHDDNPETEVESRYLADLRADLEHESSPLLADIVLPRSVSVGPILDCVRDFVTLDYVQLPLADGRDAWYRTTINSPEHVVFEELTMGPGYKMLVADDGALRDDDGSQAPRGLIDGLTNSSVGASRGWELAADELLPKTVLDSLHSATRDEPLNLLISPHMGLSRVPWNALVVDRERRVRLVERAIVAQVPMLSTLDNEGLGVVRGQALVWLTDDETNRDSQTAWGMPADTLRARCEIPAGDQNPLRGSLTESLVVQEWELAYIVCHGGGAGLRQHIQVDGELTAARALGLRWPHDVVLAACHVGRIEDSGEGEALGFVIAAMAGGARTVIAGLHSVSKKGTGEIGRLLIDGLDGRTRLVDALRIAQLRYLDESQSPDDLWQWALLTAFVR